LRERQEDVLVGQQSVFTPARLFDGAVDNPLCGFAYLGGRDVEVFYVHGCASGPAERESKTGASAHR
jgi:hypothetical protein